MRYDMINAAENPSIDINTFAGLNRLEKCERNEFADMLNMSSDRYPCLAPAKSWKAAVSGMTNIRGVIAPKYADGEITKFTGVAGDAFYYEGEKKDIETDGKVIPDGDVCLVDFNGRIVICVCDGDASSMLYYDYTATGDGTVKNMEKGVYDTTFSYTLYSKGDPEKDIYITNYIECSSVTWSEHFKQGDSVFLEGFTNDENNTVSLDSKYQNVEVDRAISCIVEKIDEKYPHRLYVQLYNRDGNRLVFTKETATGVSVYTKIPTMNWVCVHNNRLWGTNPNGEYVYASKLGDPFNFNTFMGLANDSYYAEIGTPGGFVGIVSYRDNLVAFKREYIHHIYGDKPSNFSIPKQLSDCGCIDIRSAVQIGTALYFLGYGGFYAYVGGQPELISRKLDRRYSKAVGATDGQKYIVCAKSGDGDETLVFDTNYGTWHRESYVDAVGSLRWHDGLYIADDTTVYKYGAGEPELWGCTSVVINENTFDNKGMNELWIRAKIEDGAYIDVFANEESGDFIPHKRLTERGIKDYCVPVRYINGEYYQYKLVGHGRAVIYDIEYKDSVGGRQYR